MDSARSFVAAASQQETAQRAFGRSARVHERVIDAIALLGAAMVVNLSATFTDLFGHLLLFVTAALLLWLRASLVDRQEGWQRRRVNENLEVPAAIMRSGIIFAVASVGLAWVLTSVAVAAPLTDAWRGFDPVWSEIRDRFRQGHSIRYLVPEAVRRDIEASRVYAS